MPFQLYISICNKNYLQKVQTWTQREMAIEMASLVISIRTLVGLSLSKPKNNAREYFIYLLFVFTGSRFVQQSNDPIEIIFFLTLE